MSTFSAEVNLTKDPVLAFTKDNTPVCNLAVAENRRYQKPDGEWTSDVAYYDCVVWRGQGQNAFDSLHKGDMVVITGRVEMRSWTDEKTGAKRTKHEVNVFSIGASLKFARVEIRKIAREDAVENVAQSTDAPVATGTDDII